MNKPKLVRKIIYFDMMQLAELESWYKDMSAEGLHLKKVGNTWATFEKGEPKQVHYRVVATQDEPVDKNPEDATIDGWTFVSRKGTLAVYAWHGADEPTEYSRAFGNQSVLLEQIWRTAVGAMILSAFASIIVLTLLWSASKPISSPHVNFVISSPFLNMVERGLLEPLFLIGLCTMGLWGSFEKWRAICKWQKQVQEGIYSRPYKQWRREYRWQAVKLYGMWAILIVIFFSIMYPRHSAISLTEKPTDLPLVRLSAIEKELVGDKRPNIPDEKGNTLVRRFSFLAPVQYEFDEYGSIPEKFWSNGQQTNKPAITEKYYWLTFPGQADQLIAELIKVHSTIKEGETFATAHQKGFEHLLVHQSKGVVEVAGQKGRVVFLLTYHGEADQNTVIQAVMASLEKTNH